MNLFLHLFIYSSCSARNFEAAFLSLNNTKVLKASLNAPLWAKIASLAPP